MGNHEGKEHFRRQDWIYITYINCNLSLFFIDSTKKSDFKPYYLAYSSIYTFSFLFLNTTIYIGMVNTMDDFLLFYTKLNLRNGC